jgi:hypothetical protein
MREPSGFDPTITPGTVSRIYSATNAPLGEQQLLNARTVQHNSAINPGSSGGPLFDACTAVIGVNSFYAKGAQGVFLSIHAAEVTRLLRELKIRYPTAPEVRATWRPCRAVADCCCPCSSPPRRCWPSRRSPLRCIQCQRSVDNGQRSRLLERHVPQRRAHFQRPGAG